MNRRKQSPLAAKASRLVRLLTGASRDAEFDRCTHAYRCAPGRTRSRDTVAKITGVSSTTVVSRLSAAVTVEQVRNTKASSTTGRPPEAAAIRSPTASNSPSRWHSQASTSTAARNPTVGPRAVTSARACPTLSNPSATAAVVVGTAPTASGPSCQVPGLMEGIKPRR